MSLTRSIVSFVVLALFLSGCVEFPEQRTVSSQIDLHEEMVQHIMPTEEVSDAFIVSEANAYYRVGHGPVELRVSYDPKSSTYNEHWAKRKAKRIERKLSAQGIESVNVDILPIPGAATSQTIIRYTAFIPKAPAECEPFGDQTNFSDPHEDYIVGCTAQSMFARQIHRSADLRDRRTADDPQNADRSAASVDQYRTGLRNTGFISEQSTLDQDE